MRFTAKQYDAAIEALKEGRQQLEPDGGNCTICGDSGHQAMECGHNPLVAMQMCNEVAKMARKVHDMIHNLAGYDFYMGCVNGPAAVHMPPAE